MALLYLAGAGLNLFSRYLVTPTDEDSLFPKAGIGDDYPSVPFRFGSNGADRAIKVDLQAITGGEMTSWTGGTPDGWTEVNAGGGTVTQQSPGRGGAGSAARLNGGGGTTELQQTITVRAGEWWHFEAYVAKGASGSMHFRLLNNYTGKYLDTTGAWGASATHFLQVLDTSGVYVLQSFNFQVEAFTAAGNVAQPTLTLIIRTASAFDSDVDDVVMYPGVNFVSVHGHNLGPVTPRLDHSTDNFVANSTTVATMTIVQPSFYAKLASITYQRWWRIHINGVNQATPYIGEAILGQAVTAARAQNYGWSTSLLRRQLRNVASGGTTRVYNLSLAEERSLSMSFADEALCAELRDEWFRRGEGGRYPMVVVPYDSESVVIHGRLQDNLSITRTLLTRAETALIVEESAFPSVTS